MKTVVTIVVNHSGLTTDDTFTFCITRFFNYEKPFVLPLNIGGTAVNGVDYQKIPDVITFEPGQGIYYITVQPIPTRANASRDVVIEIPQSSEYDTIGDRVVSFPFDRILPMMDLVADNAYPQFVKTTGSWTLAGASAYGPSYLHDGAAGKGTKSVFFTHDFVPGIKYDVSLFWPANRTADPNVPVEIIHEDGMTQVFVDQLKYSNLWFGVGSYKMSNQTHGVRIKNDNTTGTVLADAVRFSRVGKKATYSVSTTTPTVSAGQTAKFVVKRTRTMLSDVLIQFSFSGNAVVGTDYSRVNSPTIMPAGVTELEISVPILAAMIASRTLVFTLEYALPMYPIVMYDTVGARTASVSLV